MSNYVPDAKYQHLTYATDDLNFTDFERCHFSHCDFSGCTFLAVTFIDCSFTDCVFDGAKINYVALRTAAFIRCQIREVNFSMCDKLILKSRSTNASWIFEILPSGSSKPHLSIAA
jgi:uncharacterized protein YjbI with pentapeptide repeats